jgi:hypothetical protein
MKQTPCWKANRSSAGPGVTRTLLDAKVYYRILQKRRHLFLSQARSIQYTPLHLTSWRTILILFLPFRHRFSTWYLSLPTKTLHIVSSWNVMAHGDARKGKWSGNWRMEWVASTLHTTSEHGVSNITTADAHNSAASSRLNWRPADLNEIVPFADRRKLVSVRVPSHFKRSLPLVSPIRATCSAYLILLDLFTRIIFGEERRSWNMCI